MPAAESDMSPELVKLVELALHPDALRWAHECGWLPGTGHCRRRGCASECLFRSEREAEGRHVVRSRRRRRKPQQAATARTVPTPAENRDVGYGG